MIVTPSADIEMALRAIVFSAVGTCAQRRAIAWTTTASACAVIELVREGTLPSKGFIKQEEIPFEQLMNTQSGKLFSSED